MHITSRQNPKLKYIKKLGAGPAFRRSEGLYAADGRKLLEDALRSGVVPEQVILTEGAGVPELPPGTEVITVPGDVMDSLSLTETPQGVLFICRLPVPPPPPEKGRWLLLDRIQDPGNTGSILRTAEAFGLDGVLLAPGCADPFSPKAVRASMGAIFRLPVLPYADAQCAPLQFIVTDMGGEPLSAFPGDCIVVLGNEGDGVSPELRERADKVVSIPMKGKAESLGVAAAAAILCWEMSKCQR
jgi:TrmH family RNA methyltransferase